jgi:hypothetical protein
MPVFSRQALRRALGVSWLHDTILGITTFSAATAAPQVMDTAYGDPSLSGHNLYAGGWLRHAASLLDFRVASFNAASGAFISTSVLGGAPAPSGTTFEIAGLLPPADKDRALDDAVARIRVRQEVGITTLSGAVFYDLDTAASPHRIADVLDAYVWANPGDVADRGKRVFATPARVVPTATGVELRIDTALDLSHLLVVDALLGLTLGAAEAATVNLPDERLVLAGAAAKCWDLLAQRSPGTQVAVYERRRDDASRQFSDLAARYKPPTAKRLSLDDPF